MKKNKLTFLILLYAFPAFCQHSYKQQLYDLATITFPDTPKVQHDTDRTFYSVAIHRRLYIAQVGKAGKSLKELFTSQSDDTVYAQVIKGSLSGTNGKLMYKKKIEVNGLQGVEFAYTAIINSQNYYRYHQLFFFNSTLISYGYWTPDSLQRDNKDLRAFFGTFKLAIDDDDVRQDNVSEIAYRFGYLIGALAIVGVLVAIGFGVVYIIKRIAFKKANP
jgi:hypothetical protein